MKTRKRWWILLVGGVVLLGWFGWRRSRSRTLPVQAVVVHRTTVRDLITADGVLHAHREAEISSDITGKIRKFYVHEGDTVRKGDLLVDIDPSEYRARVREMRARLMADSARYLQMLRDLHRAQRLYEDSLISRAELEEKETSVRAQEALLRSQEYALQEAEAKLAKTRIRAPFTGEVLRVYKEEGEQAVAAGFTTQQSVLLVMADRSVMRVEAYVEETEMPRIRVGQRAWVRLDVIPDVRFPGRVVRIGGIPQDFLNPQESEGTTFPVSIQLDRTDPRLFPGMNASVEIVAQVRESTLAVPFTALGREDGARVVWRVRARKAEKTRIRLGVQGKMRVEILEGIQEGDTVIVGPARIQRQLREGMPVRVTVRAFPSPARGKGRRPHGRPRD